MSVSIDELRAFRLDAEPAAPLFAQALAKPDEDNDHLLIRSKDKLLSLPGFLESMDQESISFEHKDEVRTLKRSSLYAVVLASDPTPLPPEAFLVKTAAGDLWATQLMMTGNVLNITAIGIGQVRVPWTEVAAVEVRSPRLAWISDLKPARVSESPLVALPRPFQKDRSVDGQPLQLGKQMFAKGLGVAARSELVFDVPNGFDTFSGSIGIDKETEGRGDCEMMVLAGGRELYRQRVKGTDPARRIRLPLQGAKQITLRVEPGANLDLGDHANWCDACFLKMGTANSDSP